MKNNIIHFGGFYIVNIFRIVMQLNRNYLHDKLPVIYGLPTHSILFNILKYANPTRAIENKMFEK